MSGTAEVQATPNAPDTGNAYVEPVEPAEQVAAGEQPEGEEKPKPEPEAKPEQKREDWRDIRMRQYVAKMRAEEKRADDAARKASALETELQQIRQRAAPDQANTQQQGNAQQPAQQQPAQQHPQKSAQEMEREAEARVTARVAEQQAAEQFNQRCNATADAGMKEYPDFDRSSTGWMQEGLDLAGNADHRDLLDYINTLPNAHNVFYTLGTTPNEVAHLLSLSQRQQAIELNKVSASAGPKPAAAVAATAPQRPAASNAPPPVRQAAASPRNVSSDTSDPGLSIEKYMELRNKSGKH